MHKATTLFISIFVLILVAGMSGYAVSSKFGEEVLRREAESQLGRLFHGRVTIGRADLRIRSGLWIEGSDVRIYPSASGFGLESRRVSARIDLIALLAGRFRLRHLIVDGIQMEILRNSENHWSPYPIAAIDRRDQEKPPDDLEDTLDPVSAIETIARVLLEYPFIAQRIDVLAGRVRLTDHYVRGRGKAPVQIEIHSIRGSLSHHWLRNTALMELQGVLSNESNRRVPIELVGSLRADGGIRLDLAVTEFPLNAIGDYVQVRDQGALSAGPIRPMAGNLSGVFSFDTPENNHGVLEMDATVDDLDAALIHSSGMLHLESARATMGLHLELHPGRLRLETASFRGSDLSVEVSGVIERPLRESSPTHLALYFFDVGLDELRRLASALPEEDRETFVRVLDRIKKGRFSRIGGSGSARYSVWQAVFRGERLKLPPGFESSAEVSNVTIDTGGTDSLSELSGHASWLADRFEIRGARGKWNGVATPTLNLVMEGFPDFIEAVSRNHSPIQSTVALPGLRLVDAIFGLTEDRADDAESKPIPTIEVEFDLLEHPALIWPIRDAWIRIESEGPSTAFRVHHARWAGARMDGDILWSPAPAFQLDAHLRAFGSPASDPSRPASNDRLEIPARAPAPKFSLAEDPTRPWAKGHFYIIGAEQHSQLLGPTRASFEFVGSTLAIDSLQGNLEPTGTIDANLRIGFAQETHLPIKIQFEIVAGAGATLYEVIGFPKGFATGKLDLTGHLVGDLYPDRPLFAEIDGDLALHAYDGEIRQSIPLVAALSHATEGLNPVKARDAIVFESIKAKFRLAHGRMITEDFRLDGPLRFVGSGRFDFARPEREIRAELGIFLFRQVDKLLGDIPLIGDLIPGGRGRGLFGAYFDVTGTLDEPTLKHNPLRTLTEGVPFPEILKAPIGAIRDALRGTEEEGEREELGEAD